MLQIRLRRISQLPTRLRRLLRNRLATLLGIGFFVSAEGHILTDGLLTRDCRHITSSHGGHITKMAFDETSDLALLMSSEKPDAWASLRGGSAPQVAEPVMTMGFPVGTISALAGLGNDRRMIQISTQTQVQNSGSPLLDRSGNVVGIVSGEQERYSLSWTTTLFHTCQTTALRARLTPRSPQQLCATQFCLSAQDSR